MSLGITDPSYVARMDYEAQKRIAPAGFVNQETAAPSAKATQIGGSHYKDLAIQPVEYIHANGIAFMEGNVIKYVSRWRNKGGVADLKKARHHLDLLIELEEAKA